MHYYKVGDKVLFQLSPNPGIFEGEILNIVNVGNDDRFLVKCTIGGYSTWCRKEDMVGHILPAVSPSECECGKDKHGFASHSQWCPKAASA